MESKEERNEKNAIFFVTLNAEEFLHQEPLERLLSQRTIESYYV